MTKQEQIYYPPPMTENQEPTAGITKSWCETMAQREAGAEIGVGLITTQEKVMRITVHRNETSQPIIYEDAIDAYTKGPMYCILIKKDGKQLAHKFPLCSLFRVVEDTAESGRPKPSGPFHSG